MLANTKVKMSSRETSEQEYKKLFLGKTCNKEVSGSFALWLCKTMAMKCTIKVCCMCKVVFVLIRSTDFFWPFLLPSPLSITRFYILFE